MVQQSMGEFGIKTNLSDFHHTLGCCMSTVEWTQNDSQPNDYIVWEDNLEHFYKIVWCSKSQLNHDLKNWVHLKTCINDGKDQTTESDIHMFVI